jgi:ubiquinone/menaquinone biosynthesis C-methylase UbiE
MEGQKQIQEAARQQFDRQSAHYGGNHILSQKDDLRSVLQVLRPAAGEALLDVATGSGHTAVYFAGLGLRVTAADISEKMLEQVNLLAAKQGVRVETCCHPAEALPYADGSFDVVTCRMAAHHFACPASFIMEVARVLKRGGRLLLIDGTVEDGHPAAEEWAHQVEVLRDPTHQRFIRPLEWTHLCGHVGMKAIHRELLPMQQPDLEWYFEAADTPPENRDRVRQLVVAAPNSAQKLFRVAEEKGKWVWWWQRLVLVTVKL